LAGDLADPHDRGAVDLEPVGSTLRVGHGQLLLGSATRADVG
jgi:hypothetical protein